MSKTKKVIILVVVAYLVLIAIGIFIYLKNRGGAYFVAPEKMSETVMFWPKLEAGENYVYYFENQVDPGFYRLNLKDKKAQKISETLDTPDEVLWSPSTKRALIFMTYDKEIMERYGSPFADKSVADQTPTKWVYDLATKKLTRLDTRILAVTWMSDDKLIYQIQNGNQSTLETSAFNGSNQSKVMDLSGFYIDKIVGFAGNNLVFLATPGEGIRNLYIININSKELIEKIKDIGENAITNGQTKVAIERSKDNVTQLYWTDLDNPNLKPTDLDSEAKKAVWLSNTKILAALSAAGKDELYIFDTSTGSDPQKLFYNERKFALNMVNLQMVGKTLYFTSQDLLYRLNLEKLLK